MMLSELITQGETALAKYGDMEVRVDDGFGDSIPSKVNKIDIGLVKLLSNSPSFIIHDGYASFRPFEGNPNQQALNSGE